MTYCFSSFFPLFFASLISLMIADILEIDSLKNLINSADSFGEVEKLIFSGKMKGFFKTKEYLHFIKLLKNEYSEFLDIEQIGKTHYENPIYSISFKLNSTNNKSGMLFTGLHHAREPISLSMNFYILLKILFELKMRNHDYEELVYTRNIYFLPLINVDGYEYNVIFFESVNGNDFGYARKNRREGAEFSECNGLSIGVDLNRNYAFKFNSSESSSSSNPCDETYRGPYAFSEPETIAVKSFLEAKPEIKIAYNYHSFGNYFLIPFSFLKEQEKSNDYMEEHFNLMYKQYQDFEKEEIFPVQSKFGNTYELLNYTSDGEASDWMLEEKGILTFSPELGNRDLSSETFYPDASTALDICSENLPSAIFGIQKSAYSLKFNNIRAFNDKVNRVIRDNNFNNDKNFYCANWDDLLNNNNIEDLIRKENEIFYPNNFLTNILKGGKYKKLYSITATIYNEGFESFNYKADLKLSLFAKGVKRITATFIKLDHSASTITKLAEIFDTENDHNFSFDSGFLSASNKTKFEKIFEINKIEPNNTVILDFKIFTGNNLTYEDNAMFHFKTEFIYAFSDIKNVRTRVINDLTDMDFGNFNAEKNLISSKIFNKKAIENYIVLNSSELESSLAQKNFVLFLIIGIAILILVIASIVVLILIRLSKKRKLAEKMEQTSKKKLETSKSNMNKSDEKKNVKNIVYNDGKEYPVLYKKAESNKEILDDRPDHVSRSHHSGNDSVFNNEKINTTVRII